MATNRDAKKNQQDFFSKMQSAFLGGGDGQGVTDHAGGIVGQLKAAADDLRAAANMMSQNSQATPNYGGPNGGRGTLGGGNYVGNLTHRPGQDLVDQGYGYGYNPSGINGIRGMVAAQGVPRWASSGSPLSLGNTYQPEYVHGKLQGYREYTKDGNYNGNTWSVGTAQGKQAETIYNRQQAAGGVSDLIQNGQVFTSGANGETHIPGGGLLRKAGGVMGKVPGLGSAGKVVAGLGAIAGVGDAVFNTITNERAKNAQYQSILGGSNWSTGVHNRWLEGGFKLSQLFSGGLTGGQATEAFRGVTSLGYTGAHRTDALNSITQNYKHMGMGVDESLGFVSTMAKSSNTNFRQLATTLKELNDTAKATGQNLQQVRANFQNLLNTATSSLGGAGALTTAGSIANYQAAQGRNFSNVDYSNLIPGKNLGITGMMANTLGQNIGSYELQQAGGGLGARQSFDRAADTQAAMSVSSAVADNNVVAVINQLADSQGGKQKITASNQALQAFVKFCLQNSSFDNVVGPYVQTITAASQAYMGTQLGPEQVAEQIIRQVLGANASFTAMDQAQQHKMQQVPSSTKTSTITQHGRGGGTKRTITQTTPAKDPVLDLFKQQYANEHTHLIVQTGDGQRVVTGKYAADHLQDQIARGTAVFADGDNAGQNVADVVGGGYGEDNYKGKDTTAVGHTSGKHFTEVSDFNAKNKSDGKVIISPNPALAQLLSISATGNAVIANTGAVNGLPPSPMQTGVWNTGN